MNESPWELIAAGIDFCVVDYRFERDGSYVPYLSPYDFTGLITENLIREENNWPLRVSYNSINTVITYEGSIDIEYMTDCPGVIRVAFK